MTKNLEIMKVSELKKLAKKNGFSNYSKLRKEELIHLLSIQPCIWLVITRKGCKYCEKAKEFLTQRGYQYVEQEITDENKESTYQMIDPYTNSYRYFPIIFYNGYFIGGYTELEKFLSNQN